jgi:hypothetical protein
MTQDPSNATQNRESAHVLRFRRRERGRPKLEPASWSGPGRDDEAFDDLAAYEQDGVDEENHDDRHRMLMNVIAVFVLTLLLGTGVWIADTITAMEREQDCMMQGLTNCAPIEVPAIVPARTNPVG